MLQRGGHDYIDASFLSKFNPLGSEHGPVAGVALGRVVVVMRSPRSAAVGHMSPRSGWLLPEPSPAQSQDHRAAAAPCQALPRAWGWPSPVTLKTAAGALEAPAKLQQVPADHPLLATALLPRRLRLCRRRGRCGHPVEGGDLFPGELLAGLGPSQQQVSVGHVPPGLLGHAATVKLPLPVRCGVTSGVRGTPRSRRDRIRVLATARSSSSVCSGVSPQAMLPCRAGTSALCGRLTPPSSLFDWYQHRTAALPPALIPRVFGRTASPRRIWTYSKTAWLPGRVTLM